MYSPNGCFRPTSVEKLQIADFPLKGDHTENPMRFLRLISPAVTWRIFDCYW
jgi:hypothetical protein